MYGQKSEKQHYIVVVGDDMLVQNVRKTKYIHNPQRAHNTQDCVISFPMNNDKRKEIDPTLYGSFVRKEPRYF